MRRSLTLMTVAAFALGLAGAAASAPALDAAGKCRDNGKFVKAEMCKAAAPAAAAGGKCRDKTTKKFAKCGAPNTEPVPSKK